jgi:hypothetical protein
MRSLAATAAVAFAAASAALFVPACETTEDRLAMDEVVHTLLELDPTEHVELGRWWTSGKQLLRLDSDGAYVLHPSLNRYRGPVERGRWHRRSYADLAFEPYDALSAESYRVTVAKQHGVITLQVPGAGAMAPIDAPPRAPEDAVIGAWISNTATLDLRGDLHYELVATPPPGAPAPARVVGHAGRWSMDGDRVRLEPDSPLVAPVSLGIERDGDVASLLVTGQPAVVFTRPAAG